MSKQHLTITSLGSSGDGVSELDGARVHVPYALPGEDVEVSGAAKALKVERILSASSERVEPKCRHFGTCGGCSLQHLQSEAYLAFKRELVSNALKARGLDPDVVTPCLSEAPGGRRRATFAAARRGKKVVLGFHKRKSHDIVDLAECPVVDQAIYEATPKLRSIAEEMLTGKAETAFLVTKMQNGLDIYIAKTPKGFDDRTAMRVSAAALEAGFVRVGIKGFETITRDTPVIPFGSVLLTPPMGGFLQATPTGEAALARLACDHVANADKVLDLFAGAGTFTFRLAQSARVHAVEGDRPAIDALRQAVRQASNIKLVTADVRDLFRRPLTRDEINTYDAVVIDPPRAGAAAQVQELAASKVDRIAYVSCSPGTLARDLRTLVDGGYALKRVTPVDQFVWSAHVEAVAELSR